MVTVITFLAEGISGQEADGGRDEGVHVNEPEVELEAREALKSYVWR